MIARMQDILNHAYENRYAVGAFNCYSYETAKAVARAAEKLNTPAIIAFGAKYLDNMEFNEIHAVVSALLENHDVPIALHLDHCSKVEDVYRAINAGFTSVMYDGSHLPFEENVANTKRVVEVAHSVGVSVEAELGSIATGLDSHEGEVGALTKYTDPDKAKEFVERTGVDCLAVSIGTVHGHYKGEPNIRLDILKEINEKVGIPLVLHGGSGTPEDKIRGSIDNGIAKINVNTEISSYTIEKTREFLKDNNPHLSVLYLRQQEYMMEVIERYMKLFKND